MSGLGPLFWWELTFLARRGVPSGWKIVTGFALLAPFLLPFVPHMVLWYSPPQEAAAAGSAYGLCLVGGMGCYVQLATPVETAGVLSAGCARGTLDLLLAAPLSSPAVVAGRLGPRLLVLLVPALTMLPVLVLLTAAG